MFFNFFNFLLIFDQINPSTEEVKIADFGMSFRGKYNKNYIEMIKQWQAPEVFDHEKLKKILRDDNLVKKLDVYSFGAIIRFMITGKNPQNNENSQKIPEKLFYIINLCMENDNMKRPYIEEIKSLLCQSNPFISTEFAEKHLFQYKRFTTPVMVIDRHMKVIF